MYKKNIKILPTYWLLSWLRKIKICCQEYWQDLESILVYFLSKKNYQFFAKNIGKILAEYYQHSWLNFLGQETSIKHPRFLAVCVSWINLGTFLGANKILPRSCSRSHSWEIKQENHDPSHLLSYLSFYEKNLIRKI